MKTIYKYELAVTDEQTIYVHRWAKVLSFGTQDGRMFVWAEVEPDQSQVGWKLFVVGTGNPIPKEARHYIGTTQVGSFVWHLYSEGDLTS